MEMGENMSDYENSLYNDRKKTSVMEMRLDTKELLDDVGFYISGKKEIREAVMEGDEVTFKNRIIKDGEPKANEEGVRGLMTWCGLHLRPAIVQGNIERWEDLKEYMYYFRQDLNDCLFENMINWDIKEHHYNMIADTICDSVRLFLTRLLANKERESYTDTMRTIESSRLETKDNTQHGWNFFKKGG